MGGMYTYLVDTNYGKNENGETRDSEKSQTA